MIDAPPMLRETLMGWPRHVSLPLAPLLVLAFATVTLGVLMTNPGSTQEGPRPSPSSHRRAGNGRSTPTTGG